MSIEVVTESPLAQALNAAILPKLVEVGWSAGGSDDNALSEYIILMLANSKTQEQIAAELSGDLLNLGPDDPGAREFSQWLFQQVEILNAQQINGNGDAGNDVPTQTEVMNTDADMGDAGDTADGAVPTGPKSMRNGNAQPRDRRMLGHMVKAMDRSNDPSLHRIRPQNGTGRINTHARAPPTGPRQQQAGRGGVRQPNNRANNIVAGMQQGPTGMNMAAMTPQAQMEMYRLLQEQSAMMAQMVGVLPQIGPGRGGPMGMGNSMQNGFQQNSGRSLFDRVQKPNRPQNNGFRKDHNLKFGNKQAASDHSSSMDVEMSQEKKEIEYNTTTCNFNLSCTNKECKFAHQSPAAPPGAIIDYTDICSFGAACKNRKCTGRHPSPAQKMAFQTQQDCRFFPNCTNANCPFKHPSMPLCRNGPDCPTPNCKFTHSKIMCKFNPCLNAACVYKHAEGQKRGKFEDKVWTPNGSKEHVSERKFVDESGPEELIVPGAAEAGVGQDADATAVAEEDLIA